MRIFSATRGMVIIDSIYARNSRKPFTRFMPHPLGKHPRCYQVSFKLSKRYLGFKATHLILVFIAGTEECTAVCVCFYTIISTKFAYGICEGLGCALVLISSSNACNCCMLIKFPLALQHKKGQQRERTC
jgi:hypothetical protein